MTKKKSSLVLIGFCVLALVGVVAVSTNLVDVTGWHTAERAPAATETLKAAPKKPATPDKKKDEAQANPAKKADGDETKVAAVKRPAFDILRVEKDGSVLAAGRAEPDAKVELVTPKGDVIAQTKADENGEFVLLPDTSVAAGDHSLTLRSKKEGDETAVTSSETGIIHIPESKEGEVLAMVTQEGEASRILVKPEKFELKSAVPEKAVADVPKAEVEPKQSELGSEAKPDKEVLPEVVLPKTEPEIAPEPKPQVVVEAVEVEGDKVYVAGAAKKGAPVQVYIDNKKIGATTGTSKNRFLVEEKFKLTPGKHSVRADLVDRKDGKVIARAEVPLLHEPVKTEPARRETEEDRPAKVPSGEAAETNAAAPEKIVPPAVNAATSEQEKPNTSAAPTAEPKPETSRPATPRIAIDIEKAPDVIRTGSSVIIKRRDNLWRISRKTYGQGVRYTTIFKANRDQIRNPDLIYPGQIFRIPGQAFN